jgi:hypothetical protein
MMADEVGHHHGGGGYHIRTLSTLDDGGLQSKLADLHAAIDQVRYSSLH